MSVAILNAGTTCMITNLVIMRHETRRADYLTEVGQSQPKLGC